MDSIDKTMEELEILMKDAHIAAQDFRAALDRIEASIRYWELRKIKRERFTGGADEAG